MDNGGYDDPATYLGERLQKPLNRPYYAHVKACLIYWKESKQIDEYKKEAQDLADLFGELGFTVMSYEIPPENSELELEYFITGQRMEINRMTSSDTPCLLIIHYGGHGDKDDDKHSEHGPQERRAVWRAYVTGEPSLRWYEIQQRFWDAKYDVLLLLDCCYAAQASRGKMDDVPGTIELLAAAGGEATTPGPGDGSFTRAMIQTMKEHLERNQEILISDLHRALSHRLADLYTIPFHVFLRQGSPLKRSIRLLSLKDVNNLQSEAIPWKAAVTLTIRTKESLTRPAMDMMIKWLRTEAFKTGIASFQVNNIIKTTTNLATFIEDTLPEVSNPVVKPLSRNALTEIGNAWNLLQNLIESNPNRAISNAGDQDQQAVQLVSQFLDQLDEKNRRLLHIFQRAILMSAALSDPAAITEVLRDPACELLELRPKLILRRLIVSQESDAGSQELVSPSSSHMISGSVMEEFKIYGSQQSPAEIQEIRRRIECLASILKAEKPAEYRCLQLQSIEHEELERRFVYRFAIPQMYKSDYITLFDAIRNLRDSSRPTLDERLALAYNIAKALEQWHEQDWVHQGICSHNIVLLKHRRNTRWAFESAMLHGFEFARPNAKPSIGAYVENIQLDVYRHPERQGPSRDGHTKLHDLYSLGVVLLEIGIWRPAVAIVHRPGTSKKLEDLTVTGMVKRLKEAAITSLAHYAGTSYTQAVQACLTSDFGVDCDDKRNTRLLEAMDLLVVQKLQKK